ncbi:hypothetical protein LINGRAHAP2_LOCUS4635 [Linum grandiflorum]
MKPCISNGFLLCMLLFLVRRLTRRNLPCSSPRTLRMISGVRL